MNQRITNLRTKMKAQDLKAVLINNLKNVYYLTGFWGSNGTVLVTERARGPLSPIRAIPFMPMRLVSPLLRLLKTRK